MTAYCITSIFIDIRRLKQRTPQGPIRQEIRVCVIEHSKMNLSDGNYSVR